MPTPCNSPPCRDAQIIPDKGSNKDFHWQVSIADPGNLTLKGSTELHVSQRGNRDRITQQHKFLVLDKEVKWKFQTLILSAGDI